MSDTQITTVAKLKALLEAIDLITEEEGWTPTSKQWKRIREMIETLEEPLSATARTGTRGNPVTSDSFRMPTIPVAGEVAIGGDSSPGASALAPQSRKITESVVDQSVGDDGLLPDGTLIENRPASPGL